MANIYDMSDTWNDGGTTFTGIKMNVTDTASGASSLLMDLQVGGVSRFSVNKLGAVIAPAPSGSTPANAGYYHGATRFSWLAGGWSHISGGNGFILSHPNIGINGTDLIITRDAADTFGQRRTTNAQTFNLYNTYTDASNYERGFMRWTSNAFEIGAEAAGTGGGRDTRFVLGTNALSISSASAANNVAYISSLGVGLASAIRLAWTSGTNAGSGFDAGIRRAAAGVVQIDNGATTGAGGAAQFIEMTAPAAPATDRVRIYAEDNGSGKTRLMALFATGAAQQIAIEP